jgi:hypothetical protein
VIRGGFVVLAPLDVRDFRPVLARGRHEVSRRALSAWELACHASLPMRLQVNYSLQLPLVSVEYRP